MIEVVGVLVATGNGQHACAQDIGDAVRHEQWIAWVRDQPGKTIGQPDATLGAANSMTPPSEVILPPSKAAVTFLRLMAGNRNGSTVSSDIAGVARRDRTTGWLRHPSRKHNQQLTRHPLPNLCHAPE